MYVCDVISKESHPSGLNRLLVLSQMKPASDCAGGITWERKKKGL